MSKLIEDTMASATVRTRARAPVWRRRGRALRHRAEYAGFRLVFGLFGALPLAAAMALGAGLAALVLRCVPALQRVGMLNLEIAFPGKSTAERWAILDASMRNLGRMAGECAHLARLDETAVRRLVTFEHEEEWARRYREGKLVLLTGHFGNWELFAYAAGLAGYPVHLVHQTLKNPLIDAYVARLRAAGGTRTMRKHGAARAVLRALAGGGVVVLPLDQNASRRTGVFVDVFGRAASTNAGVARVAAHTGATVLPVFLVRDGTSPRHRVVILPPVPFVSMADRDRAAREFTQRCSAVLEDMIRRHPDHWLWTHKRWRTRPLGEPELYV